MRVVLDANVLRGYQYKLIFFYTLFVIILGCQNNKVSNVFEYGPVSRDSTAVDVMINPENYEIYDSLYAKIDEVSCNGNLPVLLLDLDSGVKKIKLMHACVKGGLYKKKNNLKIRDNIIKLNKDFPLSKLDSLIHAHYSNYGASQYLSEHPLKAFISISYSNVGYSSFVELLDNITDSFNALDIEEPLILILDNSDGTYFR